MRPLETLFRAPNNVQEKPKGIFREVPTQLALSTYSKHTLLDQKILNSNLKKIQKKKGREDSFLYLLFPEH
jgi:hypothetical protein